MFGTGLTGYFMPSVKIKKNTMLQSMDKTFLISQ